MVLCAVLKAEAEIYHQCLVSKNARCAAPRSPRSAGHAARPTGREAPPGRHQAPHLRPRLCRICRRAGQGEARFETGRRTALAVVDSTMTHTEQRGSARQEGRRWVSRCWLWARRPARLQTRAPTWSESFRTAGEDCAPAWPPREQELCCGAPEHQESAACLSGSMKNRGAKQTRQSGRAAQQQPHPASPSRGQSAQ